MRVWLQALYRLARAGSVAARARRWARIHLCFAEYMPRLARVRAWVAGAKGDFAGAAAIWRELARGVATDGRGEGITQECGAAEAAAICWSQCARFLVIGRQDIAAAAALVRAIEFAPDDTAARRQLGRIAIKLGDWSLAARQWARLSDAPAAPAETAEALTNWAYALIRQGAFADAARVIDRLDGVACDRHVNLEIRATLAEYTSDWPEARRLWQQIALLCG